MSKTTKKSTVMINLINEMTIYINSLNISDKKKIQIQNAYHSYINTIYNFLSPSIQPVKVFENKMPEYDAFFKNQLKKLLSETEDYSKKIDYIKEKKKSIILPMNIMEHYKYVINIINKPDFDLLTYGLSFGSMNISELINGIDVLAIYYGYGRTIPKSVPYTEEDNIPKNIFNAIKNVESK